MRHLSLIYTVCKFNYCHIYGSTLREKNILYNIHVDALSILVVSLPSVYYLFYFSV